MLIKERCPQDGQKIGTGTTARNIRAEKKSRLGLMSEETDIIRVTPDHACSFCDGFYFGALHDGEGAVVHSAPICVTYDELDPVDFLEANRLRREGVEH